MRKVIVLGAVLSLGITAMAGVGSAGQPADLIIGTIQPDDSVLRVEGTIRMREWWYEDMEWDRQPDEVEDLLAHRILGTHILAFPGEGLWALLFLPDGGVYVPRPPIAFSWPLKVDGQEEGLWLGGGHSGTGIPPSVGWRGWGGICTSAIDCQPLPGSGMADTYRYIHWFLEDTHLQQIGAGPGSTIELGSANGGTASSFLWPAAPLADGTGALSTWDRIPGFKLQGEVALGIAPRGTPADEVDHAVRADLGETVGATGPTRQWSAHLARPAVPGGYTVHARTCWGLLDDPICQHASADVTI